MQIDKTLYKEINEYCQLNNLKTKDFIHNILKDAFLIEKYGKSPFINTQITKTTSQEPCDKIKDVLTNQYSESLCEIDVVDEHLSENTILQDNISNEQPKPKKKRKLN